MAAQGPIRASAESKADWETPQPLFERLHHEFRFTLDGAADENNAKVPRFLSGPCYACDPAAPRQKRTFCRCGHCASWERNTVWLNPPYGRGLVRWMEKCRDASRDGASVVALLPANTDTEWFKLVWESAMEVRLLYGRVNFVGSRGGNTGGSMVAVWRPWKAGWNAPAVSLWDWRPECAQQGLMPVEAVS